MALEMRIYMRPPDFGGLDGGDYWVVGPEAKL